MGFYVQDSWKATSRLTVNLGLRYDRTFIPPYGREETVGQNGGIEAGAVELQRWNLRGSEIAAVVYG